MKKIKLLFLSVTAALSLTAGNAQTTAMNYSFIDCAGNPQDIYSDLDAGKAIILEFFMNSCSPCIVAGGKLESMKADLLAEYFAWKGRESTGYFECYKARKNIRRRAGCT